MRTPMMLAALALLLASCGGGTGTGRPDAPEPVGDWRLVEGVPTEDGFPITLSIVDTSMSGRAACNSYFGEIAIDGGLVSVTGVGQTEMACEPDVMESESAYLGMLQNAESVAVTGGLLTLSSSAGDLVFEPVLPPPTSELVGTEWVLESVIQGDAVSSVIGDRATLAIADDGTFTASTGCRTLYGTWLENGGTITFPEMTAEGECPDDLAAQDSQVIAALEGDLSIAIDESVLTITSMGNDALVYRSDK